MRPSRSSAPGSKDQEKFGSSNCVDSYLDTLCKTNENVPSVVNAIILELGTPSGDADIKSVTIYTPKFRQKFFSNIRDLQV